MELTTETEETNDPQPGTQQARRNALTGWILAAVWTIGAECSLVMEARRPQMGALAHGLMWLLGLVLIFFGVRKFSRSEAALRETRADMKHQAVRLEREVTKRLRSETARRESESFLATIIDTQPECVQLLAPDGGLLMTNPAGLGMIQADSFDEVHGQPAYRFIAPEYRESFIARIDDAFKGKSSSFECEIIGLKKRRMWVESRCVPFRNEHGGIVSALAITRDITERKEHEEVLRELSLVDELTGLVNRRGFMHLGRQQMKVADRTRHSLILIFADLDRLKTINDTFGHAEGDCALVDTATILKDSFRTSDIIARLSGDEFAVLCVESAENVEKMIRRRLEQNILTHNLTTERPYRLSISTGMAVYNPDQPVLLEDLLAEGDRLMYAQKKSNRFFEAAVRTVDAAR